MGMYLKHFPEHRLDLGMYSGRVTAEEVLRLFNALDPAANWLCYFDPATDVSEIDITELPSLKRAIAAKEAGYSGPKRCAFVNPAGPDEVYVQFWIQYARAGVERPHERRLFTTVEPACRWLELSPQAREAVETAIAEALVGPPPVGDRRERPSGRARPEAV